MSDTQASTSFRTLTPTVVCNRWNGKKNKFIACRVQFWSHILPHICHSVVLESRSGYRALILTKQWQTRSVFITLSCSVSWHCKFHSLILYHVKEYYLDSFQLAACFYWVSPSTYYEEKWMFFKFSFSLLWMITLLTTLSLAEDPCFTCRFHPFLDFLDFLDSFSVFLLSIFFLSLELYHQKSNYSNRDYHVTYSQSGASFHKHALWFLPAFSCYFSCNCNQLCNRQTFSNYDQESLTVIHKNWMTTWFVWH